MSVEVMAFASSKLGRHAAHYCRAWLKEGNQFAGEAYLDESVPRQLHEQVRSIGAILYESIVGEDDDGSAN